MIGIFHKEASGVEFHRSSSHKARFCFLVIILTNFNKGARKCNHHKQRLPESRFQEENFCFRHIKEDLVQGNYYRRTRLVTVNTCKTCLVTRSTRLTIRSTRSNRLPTRSTGLFTRSTRFSTSVHSPVHSQYSQHYLPVFL